MLKPEAAELRINVAAEIPHDILADVIDLLAMSCFSPESETVALEHVNGSAKS